jgi:hypothetical protein
MNTKTNDNIDGQSESYFNIGLISVAFSTLIIVCVLNIENVFSGIVISILLGAFIYFLLTRFYFYSVLPDKVEIRFPFRKVKNLSLVNYEIKLVKFWTIRSEGKIIVFIRKIMLKIKLLSTSHHLLITMIINQ